jgi:catechol 2,3-dioxygenase-like lactoylglutathione lyase family enzyme
MKLSHAIVFAKSVQRLRAFYEGTLGLAVIEATPEGDWVVLDAGGARLALHAIPPPYADAVVIEDPPRVREATPIKLAFHADDPEAERARLVAMGVSVRPARRFAGMVICDGVDPEGNVFQITNR